jgi:uncharacterized membrane protein YfcA
VMLPVALAGGLVVGLCLGLLGGGGSMLALPVLVYALDQDPVSGGTGALLIVSISALSGTLAATRHGQVRVRLGLGFAALGTGGAVGGAMLSVRVPAEVLLASFSGLLVVVAAVLWSRQQNVSSGAAETAAEIADRPILVLRPGFRCDCSRAIKVVGAALLVGAVTGFFGVGGGFVVVPALMLALDLDIHHAVGTALLVITINSTTALLLRLGHGVPVDWSLVLVVTAAAVAGSLVGVRIAPLLNPRILGFGFVVALLLVAGFTALDSVPDLLRN